jgi:type II secretory pathway pseudopilin PulG
MLIKTRAGIRKQAFSLVETVVAMLIAVIVIGAIVTGFLQSIRMAESSAYSVAANALAVQGYEQVRAAKWDAVSYPVVDEVVATNFPPIGYVLDVAMTGSNVIWATNYTAISTVSTNPLLKLIRIDCVYRFLNRGLFTNSIVSYRASESGQQNVAPAPPPAVTPPPPPVLGTTTKKNNRKGKGGE